MSYTTKSPWLIHYDASSCNGCDIEVLACLTPLYDIERFGIINTGNPKHADIFLVTGSVNDQNIQVVREIYNQMLEPKVVIACGICACSGGIFKECYNTLGGIDLAIPVDIYAPGCAVRPEAIIDAVVQGLDVLEAKRCALEAGVEYNKPEAPEPEAPEPKASKLEVPKPEALESEASKPEASKQPSDDETQPEALQAQEEPKAAGSVSAEG